MNSKLLWVAIIWSSGLSRCCVSGGYFFRKYELESFESKDIADYMLIGDDGNGLPESLHGLWWMDGNNVPEEVLSFGGSIWHENSRSVVISVYDEGTWTWADSTPGRFIYRFMQGLSRSTLVFKFSEDLQTAEITSGYQLFGLMFMIPRFWLLFSMYFVEDGLWVREESSLFIFDIGSYKLRRIVNATGHPTDAFDDFLASAPQNLLIARRPR